MNRKQRRAASKRLEPATPAPASRVPASGATVSGALVPDVREVLAEAFRLHQAGSLAEAERRYHEVLAVQSDNADGLHLLGLIAYQQGRFELAIDRISKAVAARPDFPDAYSNLGNVLKDHGRLDDAVACYKRAVDLRPDFAEAHAFLGNALRDQNRLEDSVASCRRALELKPDYLEALANLGNALLLQGRLDEAAASYERALVQQPDYPQVLANLGNAYRGLGKLAEAIVAYRRSLELKPDDADTCSNLGNALLDRGQFHEAEACYRKAIEFKPDFPEALSNLGNALRDQGRLDEAAGCFRRALELRPDFSEIHSNLGNVLKDQGHLDDAIVCYQEAVALRPENQQAHSNLILALHYADRHFQDELARAVRRYGDVMARAHHRQGFTCAMLAGRRLRIGYVSADLRAHPVGFFLLEVLRAHDRSNVEVFCYSNSAVTDGLTAGLRAAADHWRIIAGKPDAEVDLLVRQDAIDILVDLSGHTAGNRLAVFAGRAAPVQVTWLGYFGSTGLEAMDYILTDRYVVPAGEEEPFVENVWRLPDSYLCFTPPEIDVPIVARPSGDLVVGCFNNWTKVSDRTVGLWARILAEIPGSRLMLKTKGLENPEINRAAKERFANHGIGTDRLILEGPSSRAELLAAYNRVDIALDPFPYGGGTTTAEALWMGVPVVTLRGDRWVGRVSESILATVGLPELVAEDADSHVGIVRRLAGDPSWRDGLRRSLRSTMEQSPFCDGPRFAMSLETAFRAMWTKWCAENAS